MRFLIATAALVCLAFSAQADEPTKYYLIDGQVTAKRVADLEARVAQLEAQLGVKASAPAAAPTASVSADYVQVCENGKCSLRPVSSTNAAPTAAVFDSPATSAESRANFRPIRGLFERLRDCPRIFGGRLRGSCSSCGG